MWPMLNAIVNKLREQKRSRSVAGGFTCCVPVYFSDSNCKHELPFNIFPYRQSNAKRLLGKTWLYAISRKNVRDPVLWRKRCSKSLSVVEKLTLYQIKDLFEPLLVVHTSPKISTKLFALAGVGHIDAGLAVSAAKSSPIPA